MCLGDDNHSWFDDLALGQHDSCCHGSPRGRASSSGGRRTKPSPNKGRCPDRCYRRSRPHVICPHPSATSTSVRCFGSVSLSAANSPPTSASSVVSVRHLVGLGEKMSGGQNPAYSYIFADCLSPVCYLPKVVLASYYLLLDLHFGIMPFCKETETKYRGLTPHKITPMSGVLHAKPDLRVFFEMVDRSFRLGDHCRYRAQRICN